MRFLATFLLLLVLGSCESNATDTIQNPKNVQFYEVYTPKEWYSTHGDVLDLLLKDPEFASLGALIQLETDKNNVYTPYLFSARQIDLVQIENLLMKAQKKGLLPKHVKFMYMYRPETSPSGREVFQFIAMKVPTKKNAPIQNIGVESANMEINAQSGACQIMLKLTEQGKKNFAIATRQNIRKHLAIVAHDLVITVPMVQEAITGGKVQISGAMSKSEASEIISLIESK